MGYLYLILGICFGWGIIVLLSKLPKLLHRVDEEWVDLRSDKTAKEQKVNDLQKNIQVYSYGAIILVFLGVVYVFFHNVEGTPYEGHFREWSNLIIRLIHITFGIAWIGASFYFVFLENSLNRTRGLRDELAGNM